MSALEQLVLRHRHAAVLGGALVINLVIAAAIHGLVRPHGTPPPARELLRFVEFVRLAPHATEPPERHEAPPPPPVLASAAAAPPAPPAPAAARRPAPAAAAPSAAGLPLPFALVPLPPLPQALAVAPAGTAGAAPEGAGNGGATGDGAAGGGSAAGAATGAAADEDVNLVPTYRVPPGYPARALRDGIEGVVTVEFTVDAAGTVHDPKVLKAEPPGIFDEAVLRVMEQWRFSPKIVDGRPTGRRARQDVRFQLHR
ncbi:MAG: energy transducer TonB [Gammaproteobacteria bacterium]|nr:energy transducer TonB [Gammaproteobacteria bacterium]